MSIKLDTNHPLQRMADKLAGHFGVLNEWVALSGGVLSGSLRLPATRYEEAKQWLTEQYGVPEALESWHSGHTKDVAPLCFKVPAKELGVTEDAITAKHGFPADHINLISMMQRKDKRYVLLSFC